MVNVQVSGVVGVDDLGLVTVDPTFDGFYYVQQRQAIEAVVRQAAEDDIGGAEYLGGALGLGRQTV